ncbi:MAG TPA: GxxExxY protein [Candidatus Acidoferrales bacterium]|nr:GxxExxY protein [Candidatus Acidoferrales bacterium]
MKGGYELAGKVIGLAMKIHSDLGAGFLASIYHNALAHELRKVGMRFESEKQLEVFYDGILVGEFSADFLIENELIVELISVQNLSPAHEVQTVDYLAATGKDVGLLINFGGERLEFKKKFRLPKPASGEIELYSEHSVHSVKK